MLQLLKGRFCVFWHHIPPIIAIFGMVKVTRSSLHHAKFHIDRAIFGDFRISYPKILDFTNLFAQYGKSLTVFNIHKNYGQMGFT